MTSTARDDEQSKPAVSSNNGTDGDQKEILAQGRFLDPANDESIDTRPTLGIEIEGDTSSFGAGEDEEQVHPSFTESKLKAKAQEHVLVESLEEQTHIMHRFILYETSTRFYLVGQDIAERHFRILKIDRTSPPGQLSIFEDANVYDRQSINELLITIEEGNKGTGGLKTRFTAWALLGFIRFTEAYYMLLVTKRAQAAMLGGHYIYQVEATELIPLTTGSTSRFQRDRNPEEVRYLGIFANVELNKSFYYSYSYNITRTLQENMCRARQALNKGLDYSVDDLNDMFVWNHNLLEPAQDALNNTYDWCVSLIHGYIEQACKNISIPINADPLIS
jgi:phosphatidylinositol 3,5-bisphosphate 5-phosphatase